MRVKNHITEARYNGSNERIVGQNGEINAGSNQEVIQKLGEIATIMQSGSVDTRTEEEVATAEERAQSFVEAFTAGGDDWKELGSSITSDLSVRLEREGFMRQILAKSEIQQGQLPRVRIREPKVRSVVSRGIGQVHPQYIRDRFYTPDEFWVTANPRVEVKDIYHTSGDLLEEVYYDAMEAILVDEDRTLVKMLRGADGLYNAPLHFNTAFTPQQMLQVRYNVERWRLPVSGILISMDLWTDLADGHNFSSFYDPITKWEFLREGRLGRLMGMDIWTDGYRDPKLKVLEPGEFFVLSQPDYVGSYTERGPVESTPVDDMDKSVPARGWAMREFISEFVGNAKAVAHGTRS